MINDPVFDVQFIIPSITHQILLDVYDFFQCLNYAILNFERDKCQAQILVVALSLNFLDLAIDLVKLVSEEFFCINELFGAIKLRANENLLSSTIMMIVLLRSIKLLFERSSIFDQLNYVADWLVDVNFEDVIRLKSEREDLPNFSLGIFRADVLVDAFDHQRMELYELIHDLLIRLELKLDHLRTKVSEEIERKDRDKEAVK